MDDLLQKKCRPCEGGVPPLDEKQSMPCWPKSQAGALKTVLCKKLLPLKISMRRWHLPMPLPG